MSDYEQKIYVPKANAKEVTFKSGKTVMKLSFHALELAEFVKQHQNEKGYVNFGVSKRKEVGKWGETHTIWLDTWKPDGQQQRKSDQPKRDDYKDVSRNWPSGERPKPGTPRPELQKQLDAADNVVDDVPF
jgi:hypothetical protein